MAVTRDNPVTVAPALDDEPAFDPGDTLVLLFMCCHPALRPASAIALTLRAVGGLTTAEIAKVPERNYLLMRATRSGAHRDQR